MRIHGLFILLFICLATPAQARNPFLESLNKKQQNKQKSRWTLSDWMAQKKKFALMDSWLAMNRSSNIFEFVLSGGQMTYDLDDGASVTEKEANFGEVSGYLTIFGLQANYEEAADDYQLSSAQLNLRLLGMADQATRLNIFFGQQNFSEELTTFEVDNSYYGAELSLYLLPFLGVTGEYKHLLEGESNTNIKVSGSNLSYGAFLELGLLRVFAEVVEDIQQRTNPSNVESEIRREGYRAGLRLFF